MSLLKDWREFAYSHDDRTQEGQRFWIDYFQQEKAVYEQILANPDEPVSGTVKELAEKFNMELTYFVGYLDGINDSLKTPNPIEEMDEDTVVSLDYDKEKLYYRRAWADAARHDLLPCARHDRDAEAQGAAGLLRGHDHPAPDSGGS